MSRACHFTTSQFGRFRDNATTTTSVSVPRISHSIVASTATPDPLPCSLWLRPRYRGCVSGLLSLALVPAPWRIYTTLRHADGNAGYLNTADTTTTPRPPLVPLAYNTEFWGLPCGLLRESFPIRASCWPKHVSCTGTHAS